MKYLLKSITSNNRDLKTSVMFCIEERYYLFGVPDCLQRITLTNKMKINKFAAIFMPNNEPDYFAGLPGLLLSRRAGLGKSSEEIKVIGPRGVKQKI